MESIGKQEQKTREYVGGGPDLYASPLPRAAVATRRRIVLVYIRLYSV